MSGSCKAQIISYRMAFIFCKNICANLKHRNVHWFKYGAAIDLLGSNTLLYYIEHFTYIYKYMNTLKNATLIVTKLKQTHKREDGGDAHL